MRNFFVRLMSCAAIGIAVSADALNIIPTFDNSIANDPNGPAMMSAIGAAIQVVQSDIVDNMTVSILFTNNPGQDLGGSSTWGGPCSYSGYLAALKSKTTSVYDTNALGKIPNSTTDPVIGGTNIRLTSALARLTGFNVGTFPAGYDSVISLNMAKMNFTRPPLVSTNYDLQQVTEHEIDEVLGCSSHLPDFTIICPIDLFRYTTNLARTYTTNGDNAYFSVDGTNLLARFNMQSGGDYSDFWSAYTTNRWAPPGITPHPQVQDAFNTPGVVLDYGINELGMLDVIGWTLSDSAKASLTPPTVNFTFPPPGAELSDASAQIISGTAADIAAAIGAVRVALNRSSDGLWFDFSTNGWGTTNFDFNSDILIASGTSSWSAQLPALPDGNYTVRAQSVDVFDNASPWQSETFTIGPPPVVTFNPLTNGQPLAAFSGITGYFQNFSPAPSVSFTIYELDINGGSGRWWNGTSFQSSPFALAASVTGTNWAAASNVVLPQLNSGQSYQLTVTASNSVSDVSAVITVQAPITVLNWDPGQTPLGTVVLQNPNTNGGNYWFQIIPQSPAFGVWRTALNVLAGEADVYMSQGSPPTIAGSSYSSQRVGSDGFVLDASQFSAGQTWYILVNASATADWNLVTGDAFVYNLGSLAADNSSSTNAPIGAEGMIFFATTIPANTLAWQLWLNGPTDTLYVKKSFAPDPQSYHLIKSVKMLVVPPYLAGGTFNGTYFISVPGNPGTPINLGSRQQPVTSLPFNSFTSVTVGPTV